MNSNLAKIAIPAKSFIGGLKQATNSRFNTPSPPQRTVRTAAKSASEFTVKTTVQFALKPRVKAAVLGSFFFLFLSSATMAHELADGFVERSVAVKVRNNLATIEYSIGLNPKTRQQLIEFWASQSSLLPKQREPSDAQTQPVNAALRSPDFLELAGTNVSARLKVWVNQELVPLDFVSSLASSRHHVDLTVTVEFHLSLEHARDSAELTICDGNFSSVAPRNHRTISPIVGDGNGLTVVSKDMPVVKSQLVPAPFSGAFRYALKTSGTTVLNRSNVAFILVRSQRRLDAEISPEDRASAYKIQAEVVKID